MPQGEARGGSERGEERIRAKVPRIAVEYLRRRRGPSLHWLTELLMLKKMSPRLLQAV